MVESLLDKAIADNRKSYDENGDDRCDVRHKAHNLACVHLLQHKKNGDTFGCQLRCRKTAKKSLTVLLFASRAL